MWCVLSLSHPGYMNLSSTILGHCSSHFLLAHSYVDCPTWLRNADFLWEGNGCRLWFHIMSCILKSFLLNTSLKILYYFITLELKATLRDCSILTPILYVNSIVYNKFFLLLIPWSPTLGKYNPLRKPHH